MVLDEITHENQISYFQYFSDTKKDPTKSLATKR